MDKDQFTESQKRVFDQMVSDLPNLREDAELFYKNFADLMNWDNGEVAIVLKCHLILEHYLDLYLSTANPSICNWDNLRLSFSQKLEMVDHPNTVMHLIRPGLNCLNNIRNKYVHNLKLSLKDVNLKPIRDFISIWFKAGGRPVPDGIDLIIEFTQLASSSLQGYSRTIKRHGKGKGLKGLLEYYGKG